MPNDHTPRPNFGQPGWRRRMEDRYGWDKEFAAVGTVLLLLLLTLGIIHAGDETVSRDPKQVESAPASAPTCYADQYFLPLPQWSSYSKMPALPDALKPMGAVANKAKPAPAAVAETKPDLPPMPKKLPQVGPLASSSTPAPSPSQKPELEAVSPFLQWIKDHPQEAAEIAKRQAASYNAAQPSGPISGGDPYWMPPMIDQSLQVGGGGSSATYSTPQK